MTLEKEYLQSPSFTSIRRIWTLLKNIKVPKNATLDPQFLPDKKFFTIMAFTAATSSMSDDTCGYDESLPNFDRSTLENILMCQKNDTDDMRKLDQLSKKLLSELKFRSSACMTYLEQEQKLHNDEHHMYPEHFEILPWVLTNVPVTLEARKVSAELSKAYTIFYEYLQTLISYHTDSQV